MYNEKPEACPFELYAKGPGMSSECVIEHSEGHPVIPLSRPSDLGTGANTNIRVARCYCGHAHISVLSVDPQSINQASVYDFLLWV